MTKTRMKDVELAKQTILNDLPESWTREMIDGEYRWPSISPLTRRRALKALMAEGLVERKLGDVAWLRRTQ